MTYYEFGRDLNVESNAFNIFLTNIAFNNEHNSNNRGKFVKRNQDEQIHQIVY